MREFAYNRVCVIGSTGAGKSRFARALAAKTGATYIELDAAFHGPNWSVADDFVEKVHAAIDCGRCVIDGNYMNYLRIIEDADLIIWLDYPFRIVLPRLLRRTARRLILREELWSGNRETLRKTLSRESIIVWFFQSYWRRRKSFPTYLKRLPGEKLIFRHPREVRRWLAQL